MSKPWASTAELIAAVHDAHCRMRRNATPAKDAAVEARLFSVAQKAMDTQFRVATETGAMKREDEEVPNARFGK